MSTTASVDKISATYELGRVAHVNAETKTVGIITRIGDRRLVEDEGGQFHVGDEVVVVERAGTKPYIASLSDWFEYGTLDFFGVKMSGGEGEEI